MHPNVQGLVTGPVVAGSEEMLYFAGLRSCPNQTSYRASFKRLHNGCKQRARRTEGDLCRLFEEEKAQDHPATPSHPRQLPQNRRPLEHGRALSAGSAEGPDHRVYHGLANHEGPDRFGLGKGDRPGGQSQPIRAPLQAPPPPPHHMRGVPEDDRIPQPRTGAASGAGGLTLPVPAGATPLPGVWRV